MIFPIWQMLWKECIAREDKIKMNILFVAHSAELSGGANRSLLSVMKGLREVWGVSPSVLVPAAEGELEDACRKENIPVYTGKYHTCCTVFRREAKDIVRYGKLIVSPFAEWFYAKKLNAELPNDFDLIYTNERMIVVGAYLAAMRNIPHIWHVRSFAQENATYYPPFYYRLMSKGAQRIILISEALRNTFLNRIDSGKLCMVHNGVALDQYCVSEKIPHEKCRLLLTGRIVPPKGQLEAIKALEILQRRKPDAFELYLAGSIPQYDAGNYGEQLKNYIAAAGLEKHVHFLGDVQDISELRRGIDIELVCSWCETFGRVTVEGMFAKILVIGSNAGGTSEIILDKQTGLLYPPHDTQRLAELILWAEEHPDEVSEMVERGYQRAKDYFTIEAAVQKIFSVITEVLEEEREKR